MSLNLLVKGRLSGSELFMQESGKRIATFDVYFWITTTLIFDGLFFYFCDAIFNCVLDYCDYSFHDELRQRTFEREITLHHLVLL